MTENYLKDENILHNTYVYDDGVVKGFVRMTAEKL